MNVIMEGESMVHCWYGRQFVHKFRMHCTLKVVNLLVQCGSACGRKCGIGFFLLVTGVEWGSIRMITGEIWWNELREQLAGRQDTKYHDIL
jgi:hypothetical protein